MTGQPEGTVRHPVLQWLIYGHVWLAMCIAAQVGWTGLFLREAPELWRYTIASALGTITAYGLMRWVRSRDPGMRSSAHLHWTGERRRTLFAICLACVVAAAVLCWPPRWEALRWLLSAALLASLYVSPFTGSDGQSIGLRRIPGLKVIFIAWVVAATVVAVPMTYDTTPHHPLSIFLVMCMRMPLYLAIAITFDVRDVVYDPPALRTVPQLFGVAGAKVLASLLLMASAVFEHVFLRGLGYAESAWLVLVAYAVGIGLVLFATPRRGPLYFGLAVDGLLILIPICVWAGVLWER
jgi:hypothetical protein